VPEIPYNLEGCPVYVGLAEYTNSEGYQLKIETDKALIQNTRDALANSYWEAGYELQQEMNKGIAAAGVEIYKPWENYIDHVNETIGTGATYEKERNEIIMAITGANHTSESDSIISKQSSLPNLKHFSPKSVGMPYVPYDNYPALLHQGERVMTAAEVRAEKSGGNITVTGNSFVVREEADIQKIASEILRQARLAQMISGT
jgi:hypothetical protein